MCCSMGTPSPLQQPGSSRRVSCDGFAGPGELIRYLRGRKKEEAVSHKGTLAFFKVFHAAWSAILGAHQGALDTWPWEFLRARSSSGLISTVSVAGCGSPSFGVKAGGRFAAVGEGRPRRQFMARSVLLGAAVLTDGRFIPSYHVHRAVLVACIFGVVCCQRALSIDCCRSVSPPPRSGPTSWSEHFF